MRILHVLVSASMGGIGKLVLDLVNLHKSDTGINTGIFFIQPLHGEYKDAFLQTGLDIHSAELTSGYDINPSKLMATMKVFKSYDVIHFHCFNVFIFLMSVLSGRKIIYTEHGNFVLGRKPYISDHVNRLLLKYFLNRHVRRITFNSQYTKAGAMKLYGLEEANTAVIYNGVPVNDAPEKGEAADTHVRDRLDGKFVVGTSSRFASFKRIDRLIDAFYRFKEGKETMLLLVGNGPLFDMFRGSVDRYDMADSVIFTGFQVNVRTYQDLMDVCVFPSESEPFGLVSIEAYSLGKPVIVFQDGGGLVDIVNSHSPEDVVENIDNLVNRLEYYYNYRNRTSETDARQRIEYAKKYDIRIMADRFRELYFEI